VRSFLHIRHEHFTESCKHLEMNPENTFYILINDVIWLIPQSVLAF
jgi:hypothetical protein